MTRTFANRFNRMYKVEYFPEPQAYNFGEELVKIPGLDGSLKMSKSDNENTAIFLADPPDLIRKKLMRATTDTGPAEPDSIKTQPVRNLFDLMEFFSSRETYLHFDELFRTCRIRYGDLKKQLAEDIIKFTAPIREEILRISSDEAYISKVARQGAEKARMSASRTINEVREIIGFRPF